MRELINLLKQNDYEKLKQWLDEKNYTINSIINGHTLSAWIVQHGDFTILKGLFEHGFCSINELNNLIIDEIIKNRFTKSKQPEQLNYLITHGLIFAHRSFQDLCTENLEEIKKHYAQDPTYVLQHDLNQCKLIHYAGALGDLEAIQWLVGAVGMKVNEKTATGSTVLHFAAQSGHSDIVRYLLEGPAPRMDASEKTEHGLTALHFAARSGHIDIVRYLLKTTEPHINASKKTAQGFTPLDLASQKGRIDVIRYLLETPALQMNIFQRYKALHFAAVSGHLNVVRYLLENPALQMSASKKSAEGFTALHLAARSGHIDLVRYLLENTTLEVDVSERTTDGSTALHLAAQNGYIDLVRYLLKKIERQINMDAKNSLGKTPLKLAYENNFVEISLLLLSHHADIHVLLSPKDFFIGTEDVSENRLKLNETLLFAQALHQRNYQKALDCLKQTSSLEVDFVLENDYPLHIVVKNMYENKKLMMALLQELLKKNPNRLVQNAEGHYPKDIAKALKQSQSIHLLQTNAERFYEHSVSIMLPLIEAVLAQGFIPQQEHFLGVRTNLQQHDLTAMQIRTLLAIELGLLLNSSTMPGFTLSPQQVQALKEILERYREHEEYKHTVPLTHFYLSTTKSRNLLILIKSIQYLNHIIFIAHSHSEQPQPSLPSNQLWISDDFYRDHLAQAAEPVEPVDLIPTEESLAKETSKWDTTLFAKKRKHPENNEDEQRPKKKPKLLQAKKC